MAGELPSPTLPAADRAAVLVRYLDWFRERAADRVVDLPEDVALSSVLPSGWSPLELLVHLAHVERRWLVWGFEGQDVGDPWPTTWTDAGRCRPAATSRTSSPVCGPRAR